VARTVTNPSVLKQCNFIVSLNKASPGSLNILIIFCRYTVTFGSLCPWIQVSIQVFYVLFRIMYLLTINNVLIILAGNSCKILCECTDCGAMKTKMGKSWAYDNVIKGLCW